MIAGLAFVAVFFLWMRIASLALRWPARKAAVVAGALVAVMARYVERGVTLRRTDVEGALHVVLPGESPAAIRIEGYARRQRYWSERRIQP